MTAIWNLAWRNVWRNPRRSAIVLVAVAVGIAGSLLSMAVNYGMIAQMVETAIVTELGHVQVHAQGWEEQPELAVRLAPWPGDFVSKLDAAHGVAAWAPRVRAQGLVTSPRASVGVRISGIDPVREARVSVLDDSVVSGTWLAKGTRRVLVGHRLARRLQVGVGDKVVLSVQDLQGDLVPQAFRVGGIFATPSREMDTSLVVVPMAEAQAQLGLGGDISELVVIADEGATPEGVRDGLAESLGEAVEARTWGQAQPLLVYMVETFDTMAWILYAAVFIATAFGIANVLLMAIYERTHEIGVMLALGMPRRRVIAMVLVESLAVTGLGVALGCAAATASVALLADGIDLAAYAEGLSELGVRTRIVPLLRPRDLFPPIAMAGVAAFGAGLWPALRAVALRPADALRQV